MHKSSFSLTKLYRKQQNNLRRLRASVKSQYRPPAVQVQRKATNGAIDYTRIHDDFFSFPTDLSNAYDMDVYALGNSCQPVRTKRVRTSFKHNQLRTMKAYFGANHNPDAKDLKQLSQKTGLSKRVLQVRLSSSSFT